MARLSMARPAVPALLLVLGAAGALPAQDVSGRIVGSPRTRGAVVVVYLVASAPGSASHTAPPADTTITQRQKTFIPGVLAVPLGTTVAFLNEDSILHNLHAYQNRRTLFNRAQHAFSARLRHTFTRDGTVMLLCDLHPEMEAFILVTPSPWFSEVARDGTFSFRSVTPGSYTLVVWDQRRRGTAVEQPLLVGPGGVTGLTIRLPSAGE